jgi:lysophospholipase L1-like esterase
VFRSFKTLSTNSLPNSIPNRRDEASSLRIAGFGACMITGYPHQGAGLFEVACRLVKERLSLPVLSTIVSLGGFSAPRAEKYLKKKLFGFNPQYIVIQFGATDAQCPIRAENRSTDRRSSLNTDSNSDLSAAQNAASYHARPASVLSPLRWQLVSAIGHIRRLDPITPLSPYVAAIQHMVDECRLARIKPVVLSPFVYGSGYTARNAIAYVDALRELNSRSPGMIFVDCFRQLADFPKIRTLQADGFHLSRLGQNLVGEAVGKAIIEDFMDSTPAVDDGASRLR